MLDEVVAATGAVRRHLGDAGYDDALSQAAAGAVEAATARLPR